MLRQATDRHPSHFGTLLPPGSQGRRGRPGSCQSWLWQALGQVQAFVRERALALEQEIARRRRCRGLLEDLGRDLQVSVQALALHQAIAQVFAFGQVAAQACWQEFAQGRVLEQAQTLHTWWRGRRFLHGGGVVLGPFLASCAGPQGRPVAWVCRHCFPSRRSSLWRE